MAIRKTEAFVLRTLPFRSTSLIVTFFTRDFGKIRGLVKGVRQERELRGALYELFSRLEIIFYEKTRSDLHLVSEASLLESHAAARGSLEAIAYGSYFTELVDDLSEVHDPHGKIFDLLAFAFRYLPSLAGERLARLFEVGLLKEVGWLPYLEHCLVCGRGSLEKGFFSARQGGLLCAACAPRVPDARPVSAEALAVLRAYAGRGGEAGLRLGVSRSAEAELKALMNRFFLDRLNRPLKSLRFLEKIQSALK